jgi:hypothetical protein
MRPTSGPVPEPSSGQRFPATVRHGNASLLTCCLLIHQEVEEEYGSDEYSAGEEEFERDSTKDELAVTAAQILERARHSRASSGTIASLPRVCAAVAEATFALGLAYVGSALAASLAMGARWWLQPSCRCDRYGQQFNLPEAGSLPAPSAPAAHAWQCTRFDYCIVFTFLCIAGPGVVPGPARARAQFAPLLHAALSGEGRRTPTAVSAEASRAESSGGAPTGAGTTVVHVAPSAAATSGASAAAPTASGSGRASVSAPPSIPPVTVLRQRRSMNLITAELGTIKGKAMPLGGPLGGTAGVADKMVDWSAAAKKAAKKGEDACESHSRCCARRMSADVMHGAAPCAHCTW